MKTEAEKFIEENKTKDTNELMTILDSKDVKSEQDWENEKTIWIFHDNSTITINSFNEVYINNA